MNQKPRTSQLRVECLERRELLAGDVDVFAASGVLHIRGDGTGNGVAVISPSLGVIGVAGISQGGSATTIDGAASRAFMRIKQIVIDLGGGNDALVISRMFLGGSAIVQTGEGDDIVGLGEFDNSSLVDSIVNNSLDSLIITANLSINTGNGNDTVVARKVSAKLLTLVTGEGDDTILFDRQGNPSDPNHVPGVFASDALNISAGEGANILNLNGLTVQKLNLLLGTGQDTLALTKSTIAKTTAIFDDAGENTVTLDELTSKSVLVSMGLGNDDMTFHQIECTNGLTVIDSSGNDQFEFDDVNVGTLNVAAGLGDDELAFIDVTVNRGMNVDSGDGNDSVELSDLIARSLDLRLGTGNDELLLDHVTIDKKLTIDGGLGNDAIDFVLVSADALEVLLGLGNDEISLDRVQIEKKAKIDGGPDSNTYTDLGNNALPALKRTNFQTIV